MRQICELVVSTAQFEREHRLQIFTFHENSVAEPCGQVAGKLQRRFAGDVIDAGFIDERHVFVNGHALASQNLLKWIAEVSALRGDTAMFFEQHAGPLTNNRAKRLVSVVARCGTPCSNAGNRQWMVDHATGRFGQNGYDSTIP